MLSSIPIPDFQHLALERDQQVLWVGLEIENLKQNTLTIAFLEELQRVLELAQTLKVRAFILYSKRFLVFSTGLDLNFLQNNPSPAAVSHYLNLGTVLCDLLSQSPCATVAMVEGECTGAGLSLALACDYCIAADNHTTRFSFPEISQGILPVWGGISRTFQRIGIKPALDFLLSSTTWTAREAFNYKLIDAVVPAQHLRTIALRYAAGRPSKAKPPLSSLLLDTASIRLLISAHLHRKQKKQLDTEHYPAGCALLKAWKDHGSSLQALKTVEHDVFQQLLRTDSTQNLLRLSQLKAQLCTFASLQTEQYETVHIIGAGHLGREIAAWCTLAGLKVSLQESNSDNLSYALERIKSIFTYYFANNTAHIKAATERLQIDSEGIGVFNADIIIDATPDKLAAKQELLAHLEENIRPDALLAVISSVFPLERLAAVLLRPERLIGLHFLYPILNRELVEIIYTPKVTPSRLIDLASAFVKQINKLPLPIQSSPGLLVNRVLLTYILQGIRLFQQNVPPVIIDRAGRQFGMPLGPLEWADVLGLDYCLQLGETLAKTSPILIPDLLVEMVNAGKLGRKKGIGFYRYRHGRMLKPERAHWDGNTTALQDKLINQMSEESALCLEQGIIEDPDLLDAAIVFGAGFPAFRGGPLQYARSSRK